MSAPVQQLQLLLQAAPPPVHLTAPVQPTAAA